MQKYFLNSKNIPIKSNEIISMNVSNDIASYSITESDDGSDDWKINYPLVSHPRPPKYTGMNGDLRSIEEIPKIFSHIFSQYKSFNKVQSIVMDDVLYSDKPVVISAPTGSGKTAIFELAILRLIMSLEDEGNISDAIIVYLAPIKALCSERYYDWCQKFNSIGLPCLEITGDSDVSDLRVLSKYKILISTPEKWDTLTRRWKEMQDFVSKIKLFLIDEIHLVNEDQRGPILEVIVSRMKTICIDSGVDAINRIRFVGVSATIPNIEDLGLWLGGSETVLFKLSEDTRPILLKKHVFGYNYVHFASYFRFDMSLNYKLSKIISTYSDGKPSLVFCSTRRMVEMAADVLKTTAKNIQCNNLMNFIPLITNTKLKEYVVKGIAIHHAGLSAEDRSIVEELFRKGLIPVLISTSTLAMGVNLPAHLVIVKSTQSYVQGIVSEYPECSVLQMIGRAGRPQFDTTGTAIIMTQEKNVSKYEKLISGTESVESHLHKHLIEHLNAEITLGTITDLAVAMKWIQSTFLYIRAIKNPINYGFPPNLPKEKVEKKLEEMCLVNINALEKHGLLFKDQNYGLTISSTVYGKLMARYYLNFNTMKLFRQIKGNENLRDLLLILSLCHEFSEFNIRSSDKKCLNNLNSSKSNESVRFQIKGKIKTISDKVFCLIQAVFGCLSISEMSLQNETLKIQRTAEKVSKAMVEYIRLQEKHHATEIYKAVLNSIILMKCCHCKLWENSPYLSRQLKKVGTVASTALYDADKRTFRELIVTTPREFERILNKHPPFGHQMQEMLQRFPRYSITISMTNSKYANISVSQLNENVDWEMHSGRVSLIVGDSNNNLLFFRDNISSSIVENGSFEKSFLIKDDTAKSIIGDVILQNLVGLDSHMEIDLLASPAESDLDLTLNHFREKQPCAPVKQLEHMEGKKLPTPDYEEQILPEEDSFIQSLNESRSTSYHNKSFGREPTSKTIVDYFPKIAKVLPMRAEAIEPPTVNAIPFPFKKPINKRNVDNSIASSFELQAKPKIPRYEVVEIMEPLPSRGSEIAKLKNLDIGIEDFMTTSSKPVPTDIRFTTPQLRSISRDTGSYHSRPLHSVCSIIMETETFNGDLSSFNTNDEDENVNNQILQQDKHCGTGSSTTKCNFWMKGDSTAVIKPSQKLPSAVDCAIKFNEHGTPSAELSDDTKNHEDIDDINFTQSVQPTVSNRKKFTFKAATRTSEINPTTTVNEFKSSDQLMLNSNLTNDTLPYVNKIRVRSKQYFESVEINETIEIPRPQHKNVQPAFFDFDNMNPSNELFVPAVPQLSSFAGRQAHITEPSLKQNQLKADFFREPQRVNGRTNRFVACKFTRSPTQENQIRQRGIERSLLKYKNSLRDNFSTYNREEYMKDFMYYKFADIDPTQENINGEGYENFGFDLKDSNDAAGFLNSESYPNNNNIF